MVTIEHKETCFLCGQPVEIDGFTLDTIGEKRKFCCAGCLSIYQLLYEDRPTNNNNPPQKNEEP